MSSSNPLLLILGLSAIYLMVNKQSRVVEHFGMNPPRAVRIETVAQETCGPMKGQMYTVPGQFQAMLNPRQAGMVDYGASIRYKTPDSKYMARDMGSLQGNHMIQEHYSAPFKNQVPSNYSAGNYQAQVNNLNRAHTVSQKQSPSNNVTVNALGQMEENCNPIIYDRYVFANQKTRTMSAGDFIRGDLPIIPEQTNWFSVSANPQTMLRDGAIAVMGGLDNNTGKELMALKSATSGGILDTGSGVNYSIQKSQYSTNAGAGVKVTAFP